MKQQITKQQWDELSEEQKKIFIIKVHPIKFSEEDKFILDVSSDTTRYFIHGFPTIGELIEFLGENYKGDVLIGYTNVGLLSKLGKGWTVNKDEQDACFIAPELVTVLWEATKYKLNEPKNPKIKDKS